MGMIKIYNSKAYVGKLEKYLKNEKKTNEKLQSYINMGENISLEFSKTKELYDKKNGRKYYHFIQSFHVDEENITAEEINQIGKELAQKTFGDKGYEVAIITHTDQEHFHNHIVVNSVNKKTGIKYQDTITQLYDIRRESNRLCKEHNLERSITSMKKSKKASYKRGELESIKRGTSWKAETINHIQEALETEPRTIEELLDYLKYQENYTFRETEKTLTFIRPDGKRIRGKTLTKGYENLDYTKGGLNNELRQIQQKYKNERECGLDWEEELKSINISEFRKYTKIQHSNANETREQRTKTSTINKSRHQQKNERRSQSTEQESNQAKSKSRENRRTNRSTKKREDSFKGFSL